MSQARVLVVSRDNAFVSRLRAELASLGGPELHICEGIERAFAAVLHGDYQVVVAHLNAGIDRAQLGRMIREVASQKVIQVLALSDTYRTEEALSFFQLGVVDYLSLVDHHDQIAPLVKSLAEAAALPPSADEDEESTSNPRPNSRRSRLSTSAF